MQDNTNREAESPLPDLYNLAPEAIDEVITDLRLQKDGASLYYAVDPHEIFDFCFPLDLEESKDADIKTIADEQVALYEIFYKQRPLLLSEYEREIRRIKNYFSNTVRNIHQQDAQLVNRLIEQGNLGSVGEASVTERTQVIRENFNVLLAIAMGIYRFGVRRFDDVTSLRLKIDLDTDVKEDRPVLKEIFSNYARTRLERILFEELTRNREVDPSARDRKERAAGVDAVAIDRMIYLNSNLESAHQSGKLSRKYIVLYLSSAPKTKRLFNLPQIRKEWPVINGNLYNFWRTRAQVFAYVVHKSKESNIDQSIRNLERVKDIIVKVQMLGTHFSKGDSACADCVLKGGSTQNCRFLHLCSPVNDLDKEIQERRQQIHNLGLINTLANYERLIQETPREGRQLEYFSFFKRIFNDPLTKAASKEMRYLQEWILIKSDFTNMFTESFGIGKALPKEYILRSGDDAVTGIDQYLPTKPIIENKDYEPILEATLNYYKNPAEVALIENAYRLFLERDTDIGSVDLEHELVRCLLYLAFPKSQAKVEGPGGDERAYELAKRLIESDDLNDRARNPISKKIEREFQYLLCWAARRTSRFKEAAEYANQALTEDSKDPRFYHGLCLNTYSWLVKRPNDPNLRSTLDDAIRYAEEAIRYYGEQETRGFDNRAVIAANYNNLTFFWSWKVQRENLDLDQKSECLARARQELDRLKRLVNQQVWREQRHPEFFHTEAYLEYQEFELEWERGNKHLAKRKLEFAQQAMDAAIALYAEGPEYQELKTLIEDQWYEKFGLS